MRAKFTGLQMMSTGEQSASGIGFHVSCAATITGANTMLRNSRGEERQSPIKPSGFPQIHPPT